MKDIELESLLAPYLANGKTVGIVGVGARGCRIRSASDALGAEVLLCDPVRALESSGEVYDAFQPQWGNGMGGCDFSRLDTETFLPLEYLFRFSDLLTIQVPLTDGGDFPTLGMITPGLWTQMRQNARILCFSDLRVIAEPLRGSSRIIPKKIDSLA